MAGFRFFLAPIKVNFCLAILGLGVGLIISSTGTFLQGGFNHEVRNRMLLRQPFLYALNPLSS